MRIYLIGMPGSGKSTIAKQLAVYLNYNYIDLDHYIEEDALMFISDIFDTYGEQTFRNLETNALKAINQDNLVVSCGGGIILKNENKKLMTGLKIYLDTPLAIIKERIKKEYHRPLLMSKSLEQLYDERFIKYQSFADVIISNKGSIDTTVLAIIKHLKEQEKNEYSSN